MIPDKTTEGEVTGDIGVAGKEDVWVNEVEETGVDRAEEIGVVGYEAEAESYRDESG